MTVSERERLSFEERRKDPGKSERVFTLLLFYFPSPYVRRLPQPLFLFGSGNNCCHESNALKVSRSCPTSFRPGSSMGFADS